MKKIAKNSIMKTMNKLNFVKNVEFYIKYGILTISFVAIRTIIRIASLEIL